MPSQVISSVENNFTKGLVTEFTGMNFPENAATDCDNAVFTIVGDVTRREGFNFEDNFITYTGSDANSALSSYVWNNAGGDGNSKLLVRQVGPILLFYKISTSTVSTPLSTRNITNTVNLLSFVSVGSTFDQNIECTYADGNGYLFVFHPNCDPVYVTFIPGTNAISTNIINVNIRDFSGVLEPGLGVNTRPSTLTAQHQYNLQNQGWTQGNTWEGFANNNVLIGTGSKTFTIGTVTGVTVGQQISVKLNVFDPLLGQTTSSYGQVMAGVITGYSAGVLTATINQTSGGLDGGVYGLTSGQNYPRYTYIWDIVPFNVGYINTFFTAVGSYPSNADVWWYFKNSTGAFDPATTFGNVSLSAGRAPQGRYILNAFSQQKAAISGLSVTNISTLIRPSIGAWFQGRVWYSGVNASQAATGDAPTYSWSNNIYFSQVVTDVSDFGLCYQTNDPTSQNLFDLLPTDGGVITIQDAGNIVKLFSIQNGLLVFATNGVWFITGSQGIGFSANDYTITKISSVRSLTSQSFVDVHGLPYFWNEEGIYAVEPSQGGGLAVNPITVGTILSFYNNIPLNSRRYARGAYHPIDYVLQWTYKSIPETDVTSRYQFDRILNFNVYNKAFFPYTIVTGTKAQYIHGVNYISYPNSNGPPPGFKYPCSFSGDQLTFAEENDPTFVDWGTSDYTTFFITGYKLHGQAQKRFQIPYIYVYNRLTDGSSHYKIQGQWDYALSGDTGRWSTAEIVDIDLSNNYAVKQRRHRIRGRGLVLQVKVSSVSGQPFDIIGWSMYENLSTGV